jgi:phosphoglycolate phosphatase-like HAD superfamily hydrolase
LALSRDGENRAVGETGHPRGSAHGWIERGAAVSLIGDAPQDIQAARANRIRAISVKTGITPVEELETLQPDLLLRDLRELRLRMVE